MLCPRWDSNRIPARATTGNSQKHTESGPVRPIYDPIRSQKCGHCPHLLFARSKHFRTAGKMHCYRFTRREAINSALSCRETTPAAAPTARLTRRSGYPLSTTQRASASQLRGQRKALGWEIEDLHLWSRTLRQAPAPFGGLLHVT